MASPETERHYEILKQLDDNLPEDVIDFWSHHGETQFLVNASLVEQITDILTNESLPYEVLVDDFQTVVDDEMKQIQDSSENFKFRNPGDVPDPRKQFNLFNYHRLDDIYQYLNQVIISKLVDTVLQF